MTRPFLWVALGVLLGVTGYAIAQQTTKAGSPPGLKQSLLLEQVLPEKLDGKEAKVTLLELERAPGSSGAPHRHPGPVFVYVLEGELATQIDGQPLRVYKKGEVFYEPPRSLHAVSRNPSPSQPTRFLAILLSAKDEKSLVIPEKP